MQRISPGKYLIEIPLYKPPDALRLDEIVVEGFRAESVGAEENPTLDFGAEGFAAGLRVERQVLGRRGGVGSGGMSTGLSLSVTSDYLRGRDPQAVYDACIRAKTGQGPTRPLVLQ